MKDIKSHLLIVGLTGGIACGKTTVAKIVRQKGIPVICADKMAHAAVRPGTTALKKISRVFGKSILEKNGRLARQKLAARVFEKTNLKKKLEAIIHPAVKKMMLKETNRLAKKNSVIFLDVPLLFESGMNRLCHKTVCVFATQDLQIKRLLHSRRMNRREALARIRAQMPLDEKIKRANHVIVNKGSKTALKTMVHRYLNTLIASHF